jgi:hypothetical protein
MEGVREWTRMSLIELQRKYNKIDAIEAYLNSNQA